MCEAKWARVRSKTIAANVEPERKSFFFIESFVVAVIVANAAAVQLFLLHLLLFSSFLHTFLRGGFHSHAEFFMFVRVHRQFGGKNALK